MKIKKLEYYVVDQKNYVVRHGIQTLEEAQTIIKRRSTLQNTLKIKSCIKIPRNLSEVLKNYALKSMQGISHRAYIFGIAHQNEGGVDRLEEVVWEKYGRETYPKTWLNVPVSYKSGTYYIYHPKTKKLKLAIKLPKNASTLGGTFNDLYTTPTKTKKIRNRYNSKGEFTGVSVALKNYAGVEYWEHGKDLSECIAENAFKIENRKTQEKNSILAAVGNSEKNARFIGLAFKFLKDLKITKKDVRELSGACNAGINGFCEEKGIAANQKVISVQKLLKIGGNNTFVRKTIIAKIMKIRNRKKEGRLGSHKVLQTS